MNAPVKPTPLTSAEQRASLGNVRRKPVQIDLLTGELVTKAPKRGRGDHVRLRPVGFEKPIVPGMADYAGEGPPGKYCRDCGSFGAVTIQRPDLDTVERSSAACLWYARRVGRLPAVRGDISTCAACKLFSEPTGAKTWAIDASGEVRGPDWFDKHGIGRFHFLNEWPKADGSGEVDDTRRG